MKKLTFGTPESLTPAVFCKGFSYRESDITYPTHQIQFETTSHGCLLRLPMEEDEHIYGLGLQLKAFDLRGRKFTLRPNADPLAPTGDSHAPVPFFVSTKGYGVYVDTARYAEFYFGNAVRLQATAPTEEKRTIAVSTQELYGKTISRRSTIDIHIPVAEGVEIYIMEGDTITDVVAQYNLLSGGGCEVPEWGLSPIYRCYSRYHQDQVLAMAKSFKEDDLPISIIGLEPGWQTHAYSCTYVWNNDLYPRPQELIDSLREMGYHINLWEHAFTHPTSPIYQELSKYSGNYQVWGGCVPDFTLPEAKAIFAEHHKKIVGMGIDGFKLDECDSSDFTGGWSFPNHARFPGGLDGDQYHSLFGTLYMQTMMDALEGKPTLSEVRNAGALAASYPFVLYSDLYDHRDFIRGCATAGFSGLLWTPEVRDSSSKTKEELIRRLQANVFSVQCLINAWYCEQKPWELLGCAEEVDYWLNVRKDLIPRLKAAFDRYCESGIPPVRALVSDYTDDPETYRIDDQYLFCDDLLVAPIPVGSDRRRVYIPRGEWVDYFTGEKVNSGWHEVETEDIPVYRKLNDEERELELLDQQASQTEHPIDYLTELTKTYFTAGKTESARKCLTILSRRIVNNEDHLDMSELTEKWQTYCELLVGLTPADIQPNTVAPLSPSDCTLPIQDILSLPDDELLTSLSQHLGELCGNGDSLNCLNKWERTVYYADELCMEVNSGGFDSYLYYHGLHFAKAYSALENISANGVIEILDAVQEKFPKHRIPKSEERLQSTMDKMSEQGIDFEAEDERFYDGGVNELLGCLAAYVRENEKHFR